MFTNTAAEHVNLVLLSCSVQHRILFLLELTQMKTHFAALSGISAISKDLA